MDIPGPEDGEYPSTLRITSLPAEQAQAATLDRFERWEQGEEVPHVINFEDRSRLRELLTTRRMELLETVMQEPPESIRAFADQIDRNVRDVHHDLHLFFNRAFPRAGPSEAAVRSLRNSANRSRVRILLKTRIGIDRVGVITLQLRAVGSFRSARRRRWEGMVRQRRTSRCDGHRGDRFRCRRRLPCRHCLALVA